MVVVDYNNSDTSVYDTSTCISTVGALICVFLFRLIEVRKPKLAETFMKSMRYKWYDKIQ